MDSATKTDRAWGRLARALGMDAEPVKWRIGSDRPGCKEILFTGTAGEVNAAKKKYADANSIPLSAVWFEKAK